MGQATPQPQPQGRPREAASQDRTPPVPRNNNTAMQAGAMMSRSGGSLLKATLAAQPDPGQAKLGQVSFFAVPEQEPKTLKKHDLITIVIREESESTSHGKNDFQKEADLKAQANQFVKINFAKASISNLTPAGGTPGIDLTGNRTFKGEGTIDRTDSMIARITAEVLDVKPNGTLVLQARKRIKTDEEDQQFILTGICRVEDVTPDNTVLSTQLYDLEFQKNNKGDVRNATKRGALPKLLDFVNPF